MIDRNLKCTAVGRDFLKQEKHPSVDKFLDYRNSLTSGTHKNFHAVPKAFIDFEIEAVDEILKRLS